MLTVDSQMIFAFKGSCRANLTNKVAGVYTVNFKFHPHVKQNQKGKCVLWKKEIGTFLGQGLNFPFNQRQHSRIQSTKFHLTLARSKSPCVLMQWNEQDGRQHKYWKNKIKCSTPQIPLQGQLNTAHLFLDPLPTWEGKSTAHKLTTQNPEATTIQYTPITLSNKHWKV